jgi:hypothetical protein
LRRCHWTTNASGASSPASRPTSPPPPPIAILIYQIRKAKILLCPRNWHISTLYDSGLKLAAKGIASTCDGGDSRKLAHFTATMIMHCLDAVGMVVAGQWQDIMFTT